MTHYYLPFKSIQLTNAPLKKGRHMYQLYHVVSFILASGVSLQAAYGGLRQWKIVIWCLSITIWQRMELGKYIVNFISRRRWLIAFTLLPLCPEEEALELPWNVLEDRLDGSQKRAEDGGEGRIDALPLTASSVCGHCNLHLNYPSPYENLRVTERFTL